MGNDVANFAVITVKEQEFLDATDISAPNFISFYQSYDGVLGLDPFDSSDKTGLATHPSLFKSMVRDKLITSNIFKLELPQGRRFVEGGRAHGSLRFGQSRVSPNGEGVIRLPLSRKSISEQTWYSPAINLDWDHGGLQLQIGPNYPVRINPESLAIRLPKPLASRINQQISLADSDHHIDCNERSKLTSLVLTFQGGSRLELSPMDYALERRFLNGTLIGCMSLFYDTDRVPGIIVGAGLLENYITEWDLDGMEIRCKFDLPF
jgi:hypothetical protein